MYEKLYDFDAYIKEFTSNVISAEIKIWENTEVYEVVLEKTCFFPEQGGQTCDTGKFHDPDNDAEYDVVYVYIKEDIVYHLVKPSGSKASSCLDAKEFPKIIHGIIDWNERFDKMQNHSGEHLVSGTVHRFFGLDNVGFSLTDGNCTLDFNGVFKEEDIDFIEKTVNRAVFENIEVKVFFPSKDELEKIDYRSKKELSGKVRIVEYPGYDICACCAPHVKHTGEIGLIKIVSAEHFKGGTRMTIRCGYRALFDYGKKMGVLRNISRILSVPMDDADKGVERINSDLKNARFDLNGKSAELLRYRAQEHINDEMPMFFTEAVDINLLRTTVIEMTSQNTGICCAFSGNDEEGYRYIIASEYNDCSGLLNVLRKEFGAKGGGNPKMIQGSINGTMEAIRKVVSEKNRWTES